MAGSAWLLTVLARARRTHADAHVCEHHAPCSQIFSFLVPGLHSPGATGEAVEVLHCMPCIAPFEVGGVDSVCYLPSSEFSSVKVPELTRGDTTFFVFHLTGCFSVNEGAGASVSTQRRMSAEYRPTRSTEYRQKSAQRNRCHRFHKRVASAT